MKVLITGCDGFLGRHLRCLLKSEPEIVATGLDHRSFHDHARLVDAVEHTDAIVHLAGVNRGDPDSVEEGNVRIAEMLSGALEVAGSAPWLVYANSVHAGSSTPYGRGKQRAAEVLGKWAASAGAPFSDVVLPNVFGEGGRPDYNSFVATFCHRLANGAEPEIHVDSEVELLHAQDAAGALLRETRSSTSGRTRVTGTPARVSDVLALLEGIAADYAEMRVPDLSDRLATQLFNTYRSYLYPAAYPMLLTRHEDARGALVEAAKSLGGRSQVSYSTTKPGVTRGNHFHLRKVERFLVIEGSARIDIRHVLGTTVDSFDVSGDAPSIVDIPTLHAHAITNVGGSQMITLFWTNEIYDPRDSDTFPEPVSGT